MSVGQHNASEGLALEFKGRFRNVVIAVADVNVAVGLFNAFVNVEGTIYNGDSAGGLAAAFVPFADIVGGHENDGFGGFV